LGDLLVSKIRLVLFHPILAPEYVLPSRSRK
jgi:hypothetical protein